MTLHVDYHLRNIVSFPTLIFKLVCCVCVCGVCLADGNFASLQYALTVSAGSATVSVLLCLSFLIFVYVC